MTREDLEQGPGHYPQTPMPGQLGNSAIAGHRTTYGAPFLHIDEIEPGDEIIVTTPYGRFVYVMTGAEIVDPSAWEVIARTDPTKATLTLTSCHPAYSAAQRIIVYAELDVARSSPPGQPVLNYGRDQAVTATPPTLPGERSTTAAAPPTTTPGSVTTDSLPSLLTASGATIGGEDTGADRRATADAFSDNWFDDSAAWPHVALWGGAAAAIVIACYQLAKAFKTSWIGLGAAIAPFLVAPYFFYQNANRLLPSAL